MPEHPIEGLMNTAMNSIKDMIDVDTIIGKPIETSNNIVIIPISKVSFGFASGGSEFKGETIDEYNKREKEESIQYRLPFGGGSGAGVSINPIAFLVVQSNCVKLLPVNHSSSVDRLLDYMPDLVEKTNQLINKCMQNKKEDKNREEQERRRREREEIKVKRPEKIQMEVEMKPEEQEEKKEPINIQNIIKVEEDD
ncbi:MAG TPA: GerW family sporulation protein [Candidatus Merdicola faecigallinarum]|uniref:GerW family sporulation protein n=1 Tax=Candidatus Merdicola faecigallinarum TaxID=2840862 RepID=A0A9D1M1Q0_9FIRM|nr:GerW family sporulation protein [Candidatus Merdicola faecigallinarum]